MEFFYDAYKFPVFVSCDMIVY